MQLRDVTEKLVVVGGGDPLSVEAQRNATMLFKIHLRATLAAKRVLNDHRLNADAYEWVLGEVAERFMKVGPVGRLAAAGRRLGALPERWSWWGFRCCRVEAMRG